MKNNQNPPEYFPEFNEYHLKYYATEWIKHHKNTPTIGSIILYRCHAVYQNILYEESLNDPDLFMKAPTKYALVFNIVVPPIFKQTKEHYEFKSENYSNCEICKIMDIENYRNFLIDIGYYDDPRFDTSLKVFLDSTFPEIVYKRPPKHNFRDNWILQAKHSNEKFYRHVVVDGPKWILYDNAELKVDKDEKDILKQEALSVGVEDETIEQGSGPYIFQQTGPTWKITYQGKPLSGLKGKGFKYIHFLVKNSMKKYHIDEIVKEVDKIDPVNINRPGKTITDNTSRNYENKKKKGTDHRDIVYGNAKDKIKEEWNNLEEELRKAKEDNDLPRIKKAERNLEKFKKCAYELFRPSGKSRQFSDETTKAKDRISKSIKRALDNIEKYDKSTWRHFKSALDPIHSYYLSYTPDRHVNWLTK
jgi:hypothetical protein